MLQKRVAVSLMAGLLLSGAGGLFAAEPAPSPEQPKASVSKAEPIYGSQLMTREERIAHRNKMRSLKTAEEREQYRLEHHAEMQKRASERGVTLPDTPPARGMGKGAGAGPCPGQGGGMGAGKGPGTGPCGRR